MKISDVIKMTFASNNDWKVVVKTTAPIALSIIEEKKGPPSALNATYKRAIINL